MGPGSKSVDTLHCRIRPFLEEFWECRADQGRPVAVYPHRLSFGDTCSASILTGISSPGFPGKRSDDNGLRISRQLRIYRHNQ